MAPLLPVARIYGAPLLTVSAGDAAVLDASGTACYFGPCSTVFVVDCGGNNIITRSDPTNTVLISTGSGGGDDVDMRGSAETNCSITARVVDANGANSTATARLQVSPQSHAS